MLKVSLLLATLFTAFGVSAADTPALILSVDWEGRDLRADNLSAMNAFRESHRDVKLVQFLNAAYFTKPGVDEHLVARKIRSVLRPGDEIGLHIHGWASLFEAAGVEVRDVTSFWKKRIPVTPGADYGHEAIIEDYSVEELRKVIRFSIAKLAQHGFTGIKSFRAGGWMAGPNVREALVREGLKIDSSAVPVSLFARDLADTNLFERAAKLWQGVDAKSMPYEIETPAGRLKEFPNNAGLADYVTPDTVLKTINERRGLPSATHYGFHQETAARYISRVHETIERLERRRFSARQPIESRVLDSSAPFALRCLDAFR